MLHENFLSETLLNSYQIIRDCIKSTEANIQKALSTFSHLTENQFNWKLDTESWSVGECISHLVNTNHLYVEKIRKILSTVNHNTEKEFPYNQSFMGRMLVKSVDPNNVRKTKTFKVFFPSSSDINRNIIYDYVILSKKFIEFSEKMSGLDLKKIRISSPVSGLIRLNLGDPLIIIPKHDKRHLNQADRVMSHKNFPKK